MLEIRPACENCNKDLPPNSTEAMICTFECTFCINCATDLLHNICPNCGGNFEKRPIRPKEKLIKYPQQTERYFRPVDIKKFETLLETNRNVAPNER
jgi:hypothetical protein